MPLQGEELPATTISKRRIMEIIDEPMCIRDIGERLGLHKESVRHYLGLLEGEKKVRRLATKQFNNVRAVTFYQAVNQQEMLVNISLEDHYHPLARKVMFDEKHLADKLKQTQKLAAPPKRSAWVGTTLGSYL